jgi:hypothetical protein
VLHTKASITFFVCATKSLQYLAPEPRVGHELEAQVRHVRPQALAHLPPAQENLGSTGIV